MNKILGEVDLMMNGFPFLLMHFFEIYEKSTTRLLGYNRCGMIVVEEEEV